MLKFMGEHPISIVLVGVTLPGALAALAEYAITSGVSGTASVYSAVFGGVVTTVVLFSLKKLAASRPSQLVQQSQPERTPGPPTRPKAVESSPSQRSPVHPIDGRVFSPRTPAELVAEIEGKTTLVAAGISSRHIRQWLEVDGLISDVGDEYTDIRVSLNSTQAQPVILLHFDPVLWKVRLNSFNVGDRIVAIGKINHIGSSGVSLGESELV